MTFVFRPLTRGPFHLPKIRCKRFPHRGAKPCGNVAKFQRSAATEAASSRLPATAAPGTVFDIACYLDQRILLTAPVSGQRIPPGRLRLCPATWCGFKPTTARVGDARYATGSPQLLTSTAPSQLSGITAQHSGPSTPMNVTETVTAALFPPRETRILASRHSDQGYSRTAIVCTRFSRSQNPKNRKDFP